jgi:hypothetical protein
MFELSLVINQIILVTENEGKYMYRKREKKKHKTEKDQLQRVWRFLD